MTSWNLTKLEYLHFKWFKFLSTQDAFFEQFMSANTLSHDFRHHFVSNNVCLFLTLHNPFRQNILVLRVHKFANGSFQSIYHFAIINFNTWLGKVNLKSFRNKPVSWLLSLALVRWWGIFLEWWRNPEKFGTLVFGCRIHRNGTWLQHCHPSLLAHTGNNGIYIIQHWEKFYFHTWLEGRKLFYNSNKMNNKIG